jgi:hypothetical protein
MLSCFGAKEQLSDQSHLAVRLTKSTTEFGVMINEGLLTSKLYLLLFCSRIDHRDFR